MHTMTYVLHYHYQYERHSKKENIYIGWQSKWYAHRNRIFAENSSIHFDCLPSRFAFSSHFFTLIYLFLNSRCISQSIDPCLISISNRLLIFYICRKIHIPTVFSHELTRYKTKFVYCVRVCVCTCMRVCEYGSSFI